MDYRLGIRCCVKCPTCVCTDLFGSNAKPEGGILGRVDAVYGSIEAQKSAGSLHVHFQIFVQCLHQHTRLHTLLLEHRAELRRLFEDYTKYKAQVCRQMYEDLPGWKDRQTETEKAWKQQYDSNMELIDTPALLTKIVTPTLTRSQAIQTYSTERMHIRARTWLKKYLQNVQRR